MGLVPKVKELPRLQKEREPPRVRRPRTPRVRSAVRGRVSQVRKRCGRPGRRVPRAPTAFAIAFITALGALLKCQAAAAIEAAQAAHSRRRGARVIICRWSGALQSYCS